MLKESATAVVTVSMNRIILAGVLGFLSVLLIDGGTTQVSTAAAAEQASQAASTSAQSGKPAEYVILVVLEGVDQDSLNTGPMPVLSRLVKEGSATWSATSATPDLRLPTMASLVTGLPVEKHGITWDRFDFARGYPRPATLFDYIDLGGGKDTAIFFMDDSMYQLARPEPYIDYQVCGSLRPECTPARVVKYIRDYMVKGASGEGYGRRILDLPHLLLVHLPEPGRAGHSRGWKSNEYHEALQAVDRALGSILDVYRDIKLLDRTAMFVTAINGGESVASGENGAKAARVPWIVWGYGIRAGHEIEQPVSLLDTGATVMRTLGVETYTEWESRPVEEVFQTHRTAKAGSQEKN